MRVGYCQYCPEFNSPKKNLDKVRDMLSGVRADIIVLPELAFTGYLFEDRKELEGAAEIVADSPTVKVLSSFCKEKDLYLVAGFAERFEDKIYNSAITVGPAGHIQIYRKLHLFNVEKEYFDPGDTPLSVLEIRGAKIGVMICFDWVFPEVARTLALQGADLICHPSNLVLNYCQRAMQTRSLENCVYSITANRFGKDVRPRGEVAFTGQSQIVDPKGEIVASSDAEEAVVVVKEIDLAKARDKAITANNDLLGDRRSEFYTSIAD